MLKINSCMHGSNSHIRREPARLGCQTQGARLHTSSAQLRPRQRKSPQSSTSARLQRLWPQAAGSKASPARYRHPPLALPQLAVSGKRNVAAAIALIATGAYHTPRHRSCHCEMPGPHRPNCLRSMAAASVVASQSWMKPHWPQPPSCSLPGPSHPQDHAGCAVLPPVDTKTHPVG